MKKILIIFYTLFSINALAVFPNCEGLSVRQAWRRAEVIRGGYVYRRIKLCNLSHEKPIDYLEEDLLPGSTQGGQVISFGGSPEGDVNVGGTEVTISGSMDLKDVVLKSPPYYLTNTGNSKIDLSTSSVGIFRFYTQVITFSCGFDSFGFSHIRDNVYNDFFSKMKVNGVPVLSAGGEIVAQAKDVMLTRGSSVLYADVFFIEANPQQINNWSGFKDMCTIDVYIKLQLKPEVSPDFKEPGTYPLDFKVN